MKIHHFWAPDGGPFVRGRAVALACVGWALATAACAGGPGSSEDAAVLGQPIFLGTTSAPGTRPSAALVRATATDGLVYRCTATVIAPGWVVTARHCVSDSGNAVEPTPGAFEVTVGRQDLSSTDGEVVDVTNVVLHPNPSTDLALLQLEHSVTVPVSRLLAPARLVEVPYGSEVVIAGWGENDSDGEPSDVLLEASVQYLAYGTDCENRQVRGGTIEPPWPADRVCLGEGADGGCIGGGDSGGPTWVLRDGEWFLAGVHSFAAAWVSADTWVPDHFEWLVQNAPGQRPSFLPSSEIASTVL